MYVHAGHSSGIRFSTPCHREQVALNRLDASEGACSGSNSNRAWRPGETSCDCVSVFCSSLCCFCIWYSFHSVATFCMITYPVHWTRFAVTSEADFGRWEESNIWNLTIVFSLGSLQRSLITFLSLEQRDTEVLRVTCFAFAVEITDWYDEVAELGRVLNG